MVTRAVDDHTTKKSLPALPLLSTSSAPHLLTSPAFKPMQGGSADNKESSGPGNGGSLSDVTPGERENLTDTGSDDISVTPTLVTPRKGQQSSKAPLSPSPPSNGVGRENEDAARRNMILGLVLPISCLLLFLLITFIACKLHNKYHCVRCEDESDALYRCAMLCNDKCCAPYNKQVQESQYVRVTLKNIT